MPSMCKDCKVILGESLLIMMIQRRLMVLEICCRIWKRKKLIENFTRIRWWIFKDNNVRFFKYRMEKEKGWNLDGHNIKIMWIVMANKVRIRTKGILGEFKDRNDFKSELTVVWESSKNNYY